MSFIKYITHITMQNIIILFYALLCHSIYYCDISQDGDISLILLSQYLFATVLIIINNVIFNMQKVSYKKIKRDPDAIFYINDVLVR